MKIDVVPADQNWSQKFIEEETQLRGELGALCHDLQHIGSTSVPGLAAKPVLDIQVAVESLQEFDSSDADKKLQSIDYDHLKQYQERVPFRRLFQRKESKKGLDVNLHIVEAGHPWWHRHIYFRDYLRSNEDARKAYQELKLSLKNQEFKDVNHYNEAKEQLIWKLEEEALAFFRLSREECSRILSSRV